MYLKTLYHLHRPTSGHITSHSAPFIPTSTCTLISSQSKQRATGSGSPCSHGDRAQGHSVGLDDLDLRGTDKEVNSEPAREIWMQSFLLDTGPEYTRKEKKKNLQRARLIASNQPSDIYTSCHLEEPRRTKRPLVMLGWHQ